MHSPSLYACLHGKKFFGIQATSVLEVTPHLHKSTVISEALLLKVWILGGLLDVNMPKPPQESMALLSKSCNTTTYMYIYAAGPIHIPYGWSLKQT
jgi:hypothetical protein